MRVRWTLLAMKDREAIFDYMEAERPKSAILVDDRIEMQVEVLVEFPEVGRPGQVEGTREFVILRTPLLRLQLVESTQLVPVSMRCYSLVVGGPGF